MTDTPPRRSRLPSQPVLLGVGFAILALMGIASFLLGERVEQESQWVAHTLRVEQQLTQLTSDLRGAEAAKRGYVLTGRSEFETLYRDSAAKIRPTFETVKADTLDNPRQQAALVELSPILDRKLAELESTVNFYRNSEIDKAIAIVASGEGQRLHEAVTSYVDRMLAEEERLLAERSAVSRASSRQLQAINLGGAILIVLLAAAAVYTVRQSNRERDDARKAIEDAYANLEHAVAIRTEDLREANDEIQRFAYIVSHDLRSPLVNIMGFTAEIETIGTETFARLGNGEGDNPAAEQVGVLKSDFAEALGFIKSSITKMDRLIGAVLRLSREGRREFRPETIEIAPLLETIAASLAHQAQEAGATITIGTLPPVESDRLALEQIFSNLVDNALKYLQPGRPGEIEVKGRSTYSHVFYEVGDNGRGIAPNDHQRIFELFRRSGVQDRPGEGIGLAHVRALVRRIGGTLDVRSELGTGSIFTVMLPKRWNVSKPQTESRTERENRLALEKQERERTTA